MRRKALALGNAGQVVVEYTLLLVVGVIVAFTITTLMVSRDQNSPSFLIFKFSSIIMTIGVDTADDLN